MNEFDEKIKCAFPEESVYKCPENYSVFSGINVPSFIKDYLIHKFTIGEELDRIGLVEFLEEHIPRKKSQILKQMISEDRKFTLLTRILVEPDVNAGILRFEIPEMGIKKSQTYIPSYIAKEHKELTYDEAWGVIALTRVESDESGGGRIEITDFKPFKPYETDLSYYLSRREDFSLSEWVDLLIRSMEYNPAGFDSFAQKLMFVSRLLVFVEPNLNIIELAPKGTGKSYIFSNLTKYGWIISGGIVTRAKLFYDVGRKSPGQIMRYDFIAMDEVQTIKFSSDMEVAAGLKTYLESGKFTVANYGDTSSASFILLGNIKLDEDMIPVYKKYFEHLPKIFGESALLDRFHGFIEGWKLPRVHQDMIINGYALNVEYFSEILHSLRFQSKYNTIIDSLIDVPIGADTRDTKAIKRICSGYLKLLFPNINTPRDISKDDFEMYCLKPALMMRGIIREQIHLIDKEYAPDIPRITIK